MERTHGCEAARQCGEYPNDRWRPKPDAVAFEVELLPDPFELPSTEPLAVMDQLELYQNCGRTEECLVSSDGG